MEPSVIATGIACLAVGLVLGFILCYVYVHEPLFKAYTSLVGKMYLMKRRGFVPQFEVQQKKTFDPSREVREF